MTFVVITMNFIRKFVLCLCLSFLPIPSNIRLLITVSYFAINYLIYTKRISQWKKCNIPFLQPTFLVGHKYFLNLVKNSHLVSLDRIYRENSDKEAVGFFLGTIPLILIRSPRLVREVFAKNFDKTSLTGWTGGVQDKELSEAMVQVSPNKDAWKSGRDTLAPMFSTSRMGGAQFDKIKNQMDNLWAYIEKARVDGRPISATEISVNCVTDIVSLWDFGERTNSFGGEKNELHQILASFNRPGVVRVLGFFTQIQFPGARWMLDSLKFIRQTQTRLMTQFLSRQIQKRGQFKNRENDFVDLLMSLKDGDESTDGKSDSGMNMNRIVGLALATTLLGHVKGEGSACLAAIHQLSLHPECQNRIRGELKQALQKHKTSELNFEVINDLPFTQQCILESIRLYSFVASIIRICTEDFQVPGTEYTFKKGDKVIMSPYSVHRDPKYFENPDTFNPERFSPEDKKSIAPESFLGFGTGPRKCPGAKMGVLVAATIVASLVLRYDIKPHSHMKQIEATDSHPGSFFNIPREDVFVDLIPHETMVQ